MPLLRLLLVLILVELLVACSQAEQNNEADYNKNLENYNAENQSKLSDRNDSFVRTGGIIAGKLEASLQVKGDSAIFKIKNQTEQVKELIFSGETSYEYFILNENGETIFHKAENIPQEKQPIILKQAEEVEYELTLAYDLPKGTYSLVALLHTEPVLRVKTTFKVSN